MALPSGLSEARQDGIRVLGFVLDENDHADEEVVRRFFARDFADLAGDGEQILLDLAGVGYLDSASLGPLVMTFRRLRASGGGVALCHVRSAGLREVLALTRFDRIFPIYPDRASAIRDMASAA